MSSFNFHESGFTIDEICIVDQDVANFYKSLDSDEERIKALVLGMSRQVSNVPLEIDLQRK